MRAVIEAGAEIEFASPQDVREIVTQAISRHVPLLPHMKSSGIMPTTGLLMLLLGWPNIGRIWDVRHVSVSGSDPTASVTGNAFICVGMIPPPPQMRGADPLDPFVVWTATNVIPADANFERHECVVRHNQSLYVILSGVAAGTQMAAHAQIVDELESEDAVFLA